MSSKILPLLFFIFSSHFAHGQIEHNTYTDAKRFFYGIEIGGGFLKYDITPSNSSILNTSNAVDFTPSISAQINGLAGIRINDFLQISTSIGILYSSGTITWKYSDEKRELKNYFFNLPINFKFQGSRMTNIRPMIEFSIGYLRLLNSQENSEKDNSEGVFRMKTNNFSTKISAGIDIYTPYIKISPSICYLRTLNNICVKDKLESSQWTNPIKNMYLSSLFFCIRFQ
ncbi:MAG: outer membrane beta-barrel protein [Flavobacteriales bacterium]|nr:outer membrane beta-barrel protein [Flavobacteriales bacterium]